ncbi:MAG TPA: AraC family transcriptional regulator [Hypericibacter adhaerens]|uniref:AraC family transcriptional regulator n=1 Tax=Hypericibacter adhaerens TaxID=2602016 RepID=UPI002BD35288|nr:AraC family transcriptional regulator [Hypericibacter adhaerens]HWA43971.1 AraC family transcriptional regulator [Hypericibacter adhaerens]
MTMIETPGVVIETPSFSAAERRAELLSDLLSHIRLSGALFLRGKFHAPWALDSPGNCDLMELLAPDAERLLVFHTVRQGRVAVTSKGYSVELGPGDMAILPHADRHILASLQPSAPRPISAILPPPPWTDIPVVEVGDAGGERAEMVCGYFRCDELLFNAVLRRLPPIFAVRPTGYAATMLEAAVNYALADGSRSGGATAMDHVTELLLSETLRLYAEQTPASRGWLAAASDPVVSRALKLMHDRPDYNWSAEELARRANTSRSVLGERFRTMLGQSPIRYLVEWRMQLAADLLRTTDLKLAAVAERSGYGSEAAFSRAFRRHLGQWPAEWRDSVAARN